MDNLSERSRRAAQIAEQPSKFKVCEGCESIVTHNANMCPNCHGYRFDENAERVIAQAKLLGSRPQTSVKPEDLT
jgi:rRNA maturation endonuclease Nob1